MLGWARAVARAFHVGTSATLLAAATLQALTFVLLARGLGVSAFGILMTLQGITVFCVEAVSLGAGEAMIRRVSREPQEYEAALGHALLMTLITAVVIGTIAIGVAQLVTAHASLVAVACFVSGELLGTRLAALSEHAFIARGMIGHANAARILTSLVRLVAVISVIYALGIEVLDTWLLTQGLTTLTGGLLCMGFVWRSLGRPRAAFHPRDVAFGAMVALTHMARAIQFSADRIILSVVATPAVVGVYSAAMRGVQFALLPIQAILRNIYAEFFAVGRHGLGAALGFAVANMPKVLVVGIASAAALVMLADLFATVLGPEFADVARLLRSLAFVPILQGVVYLLGDSLSGADRQKTRTVIGIFGAALFVLLVFGFVQMYDLHGVIYAIYTHQFAMVLAHALAIRKAA